MHRTTFAGTQRTRRTSAGRHRTRTLKNWLPRHWPPGHRTHRPRRCAGLRACLCHRRDWPRSRSFVYRARSSLRNNHARRRRLRRSRNHRRSRTRRSRWSLGRGGSRNRSLRRKHRGRGGCHQTWRRCNRRRGWSRDRSMRGSWPFRHRSSHSRPHRGWRRRGCRYGSRRRDRRWRWSCHRRRGRGTSDDCWRSRRARTWRRRFFLLCDSSQHISRPGDVRQVNLGLDFFFAAQRARGLHRRRRRLGRAAQMDPYLFRFMILDGTGMGLLLRHPDSGQRVEDGFTLNFQLPGEIVDSNLAHPAFLVLRVALRSSSRPHGVSVLHSHAIEDVRVCHDLFNCFGSGASFRLLLFVCIFV